ncbi:MAG: saccharopine dehydrogenase NADP-binding domain-containing protein [Bacteroidales bacterium]|nr:saccharopine dehydrogenase NADP-binding domain-containing protein [Bacteroidales bacterium]MCF8334314.1 saccharopine dehydrogenase NADP-binding domain-containing protein [Bacteroidales bacterium]
MKKVLILGAGMVVKPMVSYLLERDYQVTVASRTKSKAEKMIGNHENGHAVEWTVDDEKTLDQMIGEHDLAVSLLPYAHHPMVAKKCIAHKKNMVTTSYVKPEMKALNQEAKDAGIIILNEIGVDPGIDHMSAMRVIDTIHENGGEVEEFYSVTGALVAPETADDNPFRYKFSWSPKGVVMAGNNDAKYLMKGAVKQVPTKDLFKDIITVSFPEVGKLDIYPNRDSMPYIDLYSIPEAKTMFRGTFRHPGWCESLDAMKELGLISYDKVDMKGMSYADMVARLIGASDSSNIKQKVADYLKKDVDAHAIKAIEWLGLFSDEKMNREEDSPFEVTSDLMIDKMMISEEERDMIAMQHTFVAKYGENNREVVKSSMLAFGSVATDTAVARTVALPAAISVDMILNGKISLSGVHIPVRKEIYNPVLDELENLDIELKEEYGLPLSEKLK